MLSNSGIVKTSAFISVKEGRDKEGRQAGRTRLTISQRLLQRGKSSRGERKHKKWKIKNDVKAKEVTSTWGKRTTEEEAASRWSRILTPAHFFFPSYFL